MTKKRALPVLLVPLLGFILVVGNIIVSQVSIPSAQAPDETDQPQLDTGQSEAFQQQFGLNQMAVSSSISALGSVEANRVASLQFQATGTVDGVYVEVGDYIEAGEVLADLEASDEWNTYNQSVLNLESAHIALAKLMQPASEEDLAVARANLTSAQAAYSSVAGGSTDAQINAAQLKYNQALAQLQALKDARAHISGTEEEIALQEAQIGAASFNAEIARLQLEALQTPNSSSLWSASVRIHQAELQLEQLQQPPSESEINSAQIVIDRAQATMLNAQTALQQTQLVSPISGYVTAIGVTSGQAITQSTIAVQISDTSILEMTVPINELDIGKIKEGIPTQVQLDALTDLDIPGVVEYIGWIASTSSDGIVTYDVQIKLNTSDPRVRIGMTGEVTIETENSGS